MPVTLTIKHVPDQVAQRLRHRAKMHHRSLQGELLSIIDEVATEEGAESQESVSPVHRGGSNDRAARAMRPRRGKPAAPVASGKLTIDQLWERARKLGSGMPAESADIVRRDRDARNR